jgi:hypothetical protein
MKKLSLFVIVVLLFLNSGRIFAQEDDVPYLSEEDIASLEAILPDDVPDNLKEDTTGRSREPVVEVVVETVVEPNEISRLNTSQILYHLLVLDRTNSPRNSDISGIDTTSILYKLKHGNNGYLVAVYTSSNAGPVFPVFPNRSRILIDLITTRKSTIREYVNSSAFRRFITNRRILAQLQEALK